VTPLVVADQAMTPVTGGPAVRKSVVRRLLTSDMSVRSLSIVVVLILWQLIGSHYPYSLSSPTAVARAIKEFLISEVLPAALQSLEVFTLGFAICVVFGLPIGLAMARIKIIRIALEPYVIMFYSLPMLALFPLMILAFGINTPLRVAACVLFGIFGMITNTFIGASRIDVTLHEVGRSFVASGWKRLTTIIFPGSLDYIFAGIRVGFGHAMIGAVVIELEASIVGVGSLMQRYAQNLQLGAFFVIVLLLGLFSITFAIFLRKLQQWATKPWQRSHRSAKSHVRSVVTLTARPGEAPHFGANPPLSSSHTVVDALRSALRPARSAFGRGYRFGASFARFFTGRLTAWFVRFAIILAIVVAWQYGSNRVSRAVLPSPHAVVNAAYNLTFQTHAIIPPLLTSLELFATGFGLALALGFPIGLFMGRYRTVGLALNPYVSFFYAMPHVVFIPIMVIWLGFGFNFGVAYVVLSAVFPVVINTMQGVHSVPPELIATGRSFCASERKILRTIVLPSTIPFVIAGARMAFSVAWIGVIVSEVLSSQTGLGGQITSYATEFRMEYMYVPILFIIAISVTIIGLSNRLFPLLTPWADNQS
jgi:ABC-type nitrate/sulfonate/bicarbonate transport system permease component